MQARYTLPNFEKAVEAESVIESLAPTNGHRPILAREAHSTAMVIELVVFL
jgi:hypothetical protein